MKLFNIRYNILSALVVALMAAVAFPVQVQAKKKKMKDDDIVIVSLDREPCFPGGDSAMFKWIDDNLRFPPSLQERHKRGVVVVSFFVTPEGKLTDLRLTKKFSDEANAEALRLVANMPDWEPGMHNGKAVRVPMSIPIAFNAKMEKKREKESLVGWLDRKLNDRKQRPATPTQPASAESVPTQPYVPAAAVAAEPVEPQGPVYFVDGVRFEGDPSTIKLSDIETYSEVKPNEEFPGGCVYITLKKKK